MKKVLVAFHCLAQILYLTPRVVANPRHPIDSSVPPPESPRQPLITPKISPQQLSVLEPLNYHDPIVVLDAGGRLHVFWDTWTPSGKHFIYCAI